MNKLIEKNLSIVYNSKEKPCPLWDLINESGSTCMLHDGKRMAELLESQGLATHSGDFCHLTLEGSNIYESGGWLKHLENQKKEIEIENSKNQLEIEVLSLQKKNLKHLETIRIQEQRIRDLEEENKFMSLIKLYWWFIASCIGLGILTGKFLIYNF